MLARKSHRIFNTKDTHSNWTWKSYSAVLPTLYNIDGLVQVRTKTDASNCTKRTPSRHTPNMAIFSTIITDHKRNIYPKECHVKWERNLKKRRKLYFFLVYTLLNSSRGRSRLRLLQYFPTFGDICFFFCFSSFIIPTTL